LVNKLFQRPLGTIPNITFKSTLIQLQSIGKFPTTRVINSSKADRKDQRKLEVEDCDGELVSFAGASDAMAATTFSEGLQAEFR